MIGTNCLPILNPKESLSKKLMKESHTIKGYNFHPIHRTINSALATISTGTFGVYIPGAINFLKMLNFTCSTCNAYRTWTYEAEMGNKYTKMHTSIGPFKEISMDSLGPCTVKSFPGSRKRVKVWPLSHGIDGHKTGHPMPPQTRNTVWRVDWNLQRQWD